MPTATTTYYGYTENLPQLQPRNIYSFVITFKLT